MVVLASSPRLLPLPESLGTRLWLFMIKNRINFSQDNSITNEIMSKLLMANLQA